MKIDAILATYNRAALLARAIASFRDLDVPEDCEIALIVVDNNSADATRSVVESFAPTLGGRLVYKFEPRQGKSHALNSGIEASSAEVVAFFDDDEKLAPDWARVIRREFADRGTDFIGGPILPEWQAEKPRWMPAYGYNAVLTWIDNGPVRRRYGEQGFSAMPVGGNMAVRRNVLGKCGPYSPAFVIAEDRDMYRRLLAVGARGYYVPDLLVRHYTSPKRLTKSYFRRWAYEEGVSDARFMHREGVAPMLAGTPRWMLRRAGIAAFRALGGYLLLRPNSPATFEAELDVIAFLGFCVQRYLRFLPHRVKDRSQV